MVEQEKFTLLVYGTLMSDGCRNTAIEDQKLLGKGVTKPNYVLLDLGAYPGLVTAEEGDEGKAIEGELWEINSSILPLLDSIECVPHLYRTGTVEIEGHEGPVYAYFYQRRSKKTAIYDKDRWDNSRQRNR